MKISSKTWCPRPGCDGAFESTLEKEDLVFRIDKCAKCQYKKATLLSGPYAGHISYTKDGENVKFTDER